DCRTTIQADTDAVSWEFVGICEGAANTFAVNKMCPDGELGSMAIEVLETFTDRELAFSKLSGPEFGGYEIFEARYNGQLELEREQATAAGEDVPGWVPEKAPTLEELLIRIGCEMPA